MQNEMAKFILVAILTNAEPNWVQEILFLFLGDEWVTLELIVSMALKRFHNILSFFCMHIFQPFKIILKFTIKVATIRNRNHDIIKTFVDWIKLIG